MSYNRTLTTQHETTIKSNQFIDDVTIEYGAWVFNKKALTLHKDAKVASKVHSNSELLELSETELQQIVDRIQNIQMSAATDNVRKRNFDTSDNLQQLDGFEDYGYGNTPEMEDDYTILNHNGKRAKPNPLTTSTESTVTTTSVPRGNNIVNSSSSKIPSVIPSTTGSKQAKVANREHLVATVGIKVKLPVKTSSSSSAACTKAASRIEPYDISDSKTALEIVDDLDLSNAPQIVKSYVAVLKVLNKEINNLIDCLFLVEPNHPYYESMQQHISYLVQYLRGNYAFMQ